MDISLFQQCVFELVGTLVLILLGCGICCAVNLNKSKAKGGGWIVITVGWGFAVMCGVFVAGPYSGAHLSPAVTLGFALAGLFPWSSVIPYCIAQFIGGFLGACLAYAFYADHFAATADDLEAMINFLTEKGHPVFGMEPFDI